MSDLIGTFGDIIKKRFGSSAGSTANPSLFTGAMTSSGKGPVDDLVFRPGTTPARQDDLVHRPDTGEYGLQLLGTGKEPSGNIAEYQPSASGYQPSNVKPVEDPLGGPGTTTPSTQRYLSEQRSLPSESDYIAQNRPQGVKQRILSAAKLGGRLLVQSGLNPLAAAEGLAIGGLDKDAYARDVYRTSVEPRSSARQQRYLNQAQGEQGLAKGQLDMAAEQQRMDQERDRAKRDAAAQDFELNVLGPIRQQVLSGQISEQEAQRRLTDAQAAHQEALSKQPFRGMAPIQDATGQYWDISDPRQPLKIAIPPGIPKGSSGRNQYVHYQAGDDGVLYGITAQGEYEPVRNKAGEPLQTPDKEAARDYEAEARAGVDYDAEVKNYKDSKRTDLYQRLGITQDIMSLANRSSTPGTSGAEAAQRVRQAEEQLDKEARQSVDELIKKRAATGKAASAKRPSKVGTKTAGGSVTTQTKWQDRPETERTTLLNNYKTHKGNPQARASFKRQYGIDPETGQ